MQSGVSEIANALVHELRYSEAEAPVKSVFSRNPTIFRGGIA